MLDNVYMKRIKMTFLHLLVYNLPYIIHKNGICLKYYATFKTDLTSSNVRPMIYYMYFRERLI